MIGITEATLNDYFHFWQYVHVLTNAEVLYLGLSVDVGCNNNSCEQQDLTLAKLTWPSRGQKGCRISMQQEMLTENRQPLWVGIYDSNLCLSETDVTLDRLSTICVSV